VTAWAGFQFNIRYEKVECPAPVGGALVYFWNTVMKPAKLFTAKPVLRGHVWDKEKVVF
jgi:hypothetical protein